MFYIANMQMMQQQYETPLNISSTLPLHAARPHIAFYFANPICIAAVKLTNPSIQAI